MNRRKETYSKRTSTKAQDERCFIQEPRMVVDCRFVSRRHLCGRVCGRGRPCTVSPSVSISGEEIEDSDGEQENRTILEHERITSTEVDDLRAILSGSRPVLVQHPIVGELPTPAANMIQDASAQHLELLDDV